MGSRVLCALLLWTAASRAETLREAVDGYLRAAEGAPRPWKIAGNVGITVTEGNSDTLTVTAGAEGAREFEPWKILLKIRAIYAESGGVETANEQVFTERLERALTERSWLFQEFMLEHDEQEALSYRIQFTLGYKRQLVRREGFNLYAEAGGGVLYERFRAATETEGIAQLGFNLDWKLTDHLLFTQSFTIYPSFSEGGEYRFVSESVFTTPIGEKVDLRFSIIDKFDSQPPAGVKENDLQVTLSLAIRFTGAK